MSLTAAIVVPCYNEAERLDIRAFVALLRSYPNIHLQFVDDGSTDATLRRLRDLSRRSESGRVRVLELQNNRGKAEAVRLGVLAAVDGWGEGLDFIGYWDADLATPLSVVPQFIQQLVLKPQLQLVMGSRVRLMGRSIERRMLRHYTGRIYATLAAIALGFPVYDTQCGAKLFRLTPDVREAFRNPFVTTWAFDVELLARLHRLCGQDLGGTGIVMEYPLESWRDVAGSKVKLSHLPRMLSDLLRIRRFIRDRKS